MGPIFGGMLFSGEKVARMILERLKSGKQIKTTGATISISALWDMLLDLQGIEEAI